MQTIPSKRICINYCCPPLWNTALNFLLWSTLGITSIVVAYLFFMYVMDTTIKADPGPQQGARVGDPASYDDIVEKYLSAIPFIGKFLYP